MTHQERVGNLKALGYTERESEFLCRAALHSGYFVRRQFLTFVQRNWGKLDASLIDKAVQNGHAKPLIFRHKREVFSLCSKTFFEALGEVDNRNRRCHEVFTIKSRLIGLDFVLANRDFEFVATEREKISFFRDTLGIGIERFPTKRYRARRSAESTDRFFVDKFPIAVDHISNPGGPVILFGYVDEGVHTTSGFKMYLEQYRRLFAGVPAFRLVYIATSARHFEAARRIFQNEIAGVPNSVREESAIAAPLRYFKDRDAYERGELGRFDQNRLIQFRADRREFAGPKWNELFVAWKSRGDEALIRALRPEAATNVAAKGDFDTHLSTFRYELFGTLANSNPTAGIALSAGGRR